MHHGTVIASQTSRTGGGILNEGALTVLNSEVRDNRVSSSAGQLGGGGLANGTGAAMILAFSTVADNVAADGLFGGGIVNDGGLLLDTVTVAQNTAFGTNGGGGLFQASAFDTQVRNVTFFDNLVGNTGTAIGASSGSSAITIANSIVASASTGACSSTTRFSSLGFNLFRDSSCVVTLAQGDRTGGALVLGPFGLHGGQTRNYVPLLNSIVLDGGTPTFPCGGSLHRTSAGYRASRPHLRPSRPDVTWARWRSRIRRGSVRGRRRAGRRAEHHLSLRSPACTLRQAIVDANAFGKAASA